MRIVGIRIQDIVNIYGGIMSICTSSCIARFAALLYKWHKNKKQEQ